MLAGWTRTEIGGKGADVFDPPGGARFGVVYLHDMDGVTPTTDVAFTAALAAQRVACVAPHGGASGWLDRVQPAFDPVVTAERHLLTAVVPAFARWRLATAALGAFGVGMGGQGALRLAFRHPKTFPVAASVDGAFDFHDAYGEGGPLDDLYDSKEQARQDTPLMHVPPYDYPPHLFFAAAAESRWFRGNDRLHEKLNALGIPHGYDFDVAPTAERIVAFLAESLAKESRRLM